MSWRIGLKDRVCNIHGVHEGKKPFKCKNCELKVHIENIHGKNEPLKCEKVHDKKNPLKIGSLNIGRGLYKKRRTPYEQNL